MLKYLIVKELKQIFRSGFLPKLISIMPIVVIGVLPFAANQEIKGLKVSIVDSDRTTISEKLVNKILSGKYFALQDRYASFNEAMKAVENGSSDVVIEIPAEFEKKLLREGTSKVNIKINGVNGMKASLGSNYLTSIINDYASGLKEHYRSSQGNSTGEVFSIKPYYLFNPKLDYKVFMVPAIMVMLLTLMCGFLPALNIVGEKEKGTLGQINVTPVTRLAFILSKLIPYWLIGLVIFYFVYAFIYMVLWLSIKRVFAYNIWFCVAVYTCYFRLGTCRFQLRTNYATIHVYYLFLYADIYFDVRPIYSYCKYAELDSDNNYI